MQCSSKMNGIIRIALVVGGILLLVGAPFAVSAESRESIIRPPVRMSLRALGECSGLFSSTYFRSESPALRRVLVLIQNAALPEDTTCKFKLAIRASGAGRVPRKVRFYRELDGIVRINSAAGPTPVEYVDVVLRGERVLTGTAEFLIKAESKNVIFVRILPIRELPGRRPVIL